MRKRDFRNKKMRRQCTSPCNILRFNGPCYDSSSIRSLPKFCEAHTHAASATRARGANVNGHFRDNFYGLIERLSSIA